MKRLILILLAMSSVKVKLPEIAATYKQNPAIGMKLFAEYAQNYYTLHVPVWEHGEQWTYRWDYENGRWIVRREPTALSMLNGATRTVTAVTTYTMSDGKWMLTGRNEKEEVDFEFTDKVYSPQWRYKPPEPEPPDPNAVAEVMKLFYGMVDPNLL